MPPALIIATRNPGKLREFRRLLAPYPWVLQSLDEVGFDGDLAEPGPGYSENARAKADRITAATGQAAFAEDSGIEVRALDDWPGPCSARWMGSEATDDDRLHGLLTVVDQCCTRDRRCRYVAVVALSRPAKPTVVARGSCDGTLTEPLGDGGFGYDPAFFSDDLGGRFGTAPPRAKDGVSHRARAIRALAESGALHAS